MTCIALLLFSSMSLSAGKLRVQNSTAEICKDSDLIFDTALRHSKELDLTKNVKTEIHRMQFEYKKRVIELESQIDKNDISRLQAILENSQIELKTLNETVIALQKDVFILQLDNEKNLLNLLTPEQQSLFRGFRVQDEKSCKANSLETTQPPTNLEAFGMPRVEALTTDIAALTGEKLLKWIGIPFTIIVTVFTLLGGLIGFLGIKESLNFKKFADESKNEIEENKNIIEGLATTSKSDAQSARTEFEQIRIYRDQAESITNELDNRSDNSSYIFIDIERRLARLEKTCKLPDEEALMKRAQALKGKGIDK